MSGKRHILRAPAGDHQEAAFRKESLYAYQLVPLRSGAGGTVTS